jgi:lycopene cyclase domain-containing protein
MQFEYLAFNIIVMTGPLFFGSFKRFYFLNMWQSALISAVIVSIPYLIWDALVTGKHWTFNSSYVTGISLAGLPIEECMFFITVPFACLFTWEMVNRFITNLDSNLGLYLRKIAMVLPVAAIWLFLDGKQYTGLVLIFLSIAVFIDKVAATNLLLKRNFYIYLGYIIFFTLIFNGYLTWRPVVLYGESYQIGFRIFTIPLEDFGYGISFLFLCTILFEKLKIKRVAI